MRRWFDPPTHYQECFLTKVHRELRVDAFKFTNRKGSKFGEKLLFLGILKPPTEINHLIRAKFYEISVGGFREKYCYTVRVIFEVL